MDNNTIINNISVLSDTYNKAKAHKDEDLAKDVSDKIKELIKLIKIF